MISRSISLKVGTLVLVGALVATLTACGGNGGDDPGGTGKAEETATTTAEPTPTNDPDEVQVVTGQVPADAASQMAALAEPLFPLAVESAEQPVNPAYSPLSVYLALGLVANGASGQSAEEFAALLGGDLDKVNQLAAGVMTEYVTTSDGPTLAVANSLWLNLNFTVDPGFEETAKAVFRAEATSLDLQAEGKERINTWVAEKTNDLIQAIIDEVNDQAVAYLVNALYFKGTWKEQFSEGATQDQSFTLADGTTVQVPTMVVTDLYAPYFKTDAGEGIILPYEGGRFAMALYMPAGGLDQISWNGQEIASWLATAEDVDGIDLYLPKWESNLSVKLNEPLQALGLVTPFTGGANDLVGIGTTNSGQPIFVSEVAHKTVVKVDEFGTEAAAVTSIGMDAMAAPVEPIQVHFDRPFAYAIVDLDTGLPLFIGQVDNP